MPDGSRECRGCQLKLRRLAADRERICAIVVELMQYEWSNTGESPDVTGLLHAIREGWPAEGIEERVRHWRYKR